MTTTEGYALLPIEELHESPLNPRKHFDKAALEELADSISAKGILTPLLVRPNAKGFEIGAGHRRLRAAKIAGLGQLPCVVRQMSDADFLELIVVENDQREDVHPLEQAEGYKRLMLLDGYDAKRIAERIGRSEKWVYDRIKLLALTKEAQQLFLLDGRITAGHAILLARLSAADQQRVIGDPPGEHGGLFKYESLLWDPESDEAGEESLKPVSVRELDAWINEHVRFDPKKADPVLFPEVVERAAEAPKPLVPITYESHIQPEARDGKVRTWGPRAWKRADGSKGAKRCDFAVAAIVAIGPRRGETFDVCLSSQRDRCATHWSKEKADAAKNAKLRASGSSTRRADNTYEKAEERRRAEEAKREALQARYKVAAPAIITAIAAAVDKAPLARIGKELLEYVAPDRYSRPVVKLDDFHQAGKTADSILRHAALFATLNDLAPYRLDEELERASKAWGVDVKTILEKEAPAPKPEKAAATDKPKKKAAKK